MKPSFLIYKSFYEPIKHLTNEELGMLFRMIFEYQINSTESTAVEPVNRAVFMAFEFMKNQFELDNEKYEKFIESQREKGKKSAQVRQTKNEPRLTTVNHGQPNQPVSTYKEKEKDIIKEKDEISKILEKFNSVTKKNFKASTSWKKNFKKWRQEYPLKEILIAIERIPLHPWFRQNPGAQTPTVFFRTNNDWIASCLDVQAKKEYILN